MSERPPIITKSNSLFAACEKWVREKVGVFDSGDRRVYFGYLANSCCLVGIGIEDCKMAIQNAYLGQDSIFTVKEILESVEQCYVGQPQEAEFKNGELVDRKTGKPAVIDIALGPVADVIYASEVKQEAKDIYHNGYKSAESTGVFEVDYHFKWKRKEVSLLGGIGNHGKSAFWGFLMLNKSVKDGTKWAVFGPEAYPPEEFYHDLVETYVGADCTPNNPDKPREEIYDIAYAFVQAHFFYVYPEKVAPTPAYILSRFLQLILKEGIDGCVVDPFNQLDKDNANSRDDQYISVVLSDFGRFAVMNNVYFSIIAHPKLLKKNAEGGYDCPEPYDLAGGAMWLNKLHNILMYHRPNHHKDPTDPTCEFHAKKIKKQKSVGRLGFISFRYDIVRRRYIFDSLYPLKTIEFVGESTFKTPAIQRISEPRLPKSGTLYGMPDSPFDPNDELL